VCRNKIRELHQLGGCLRSNRDRLVGIAKGDRGEFLRCKKVPLPIGLVACHILNVEEKFARFGFTVIARFEFEKRFRILKSGASLFARSRKCQIIRRNPPDTVGVVAAVEAN